MFTLLYTDAEGHSAAHELRDGESLIGRAPSCDLVLNHPTVSRRHARVRVKGAEVWLADAGSTYGTMLNGVPVTSDRPLRAGDVVVLGEIELTLTGGLKADQVLSDAHTVIEDLGTIIRRVDEIDRAGAAAAAVPGGGPATSSPSSSSSEVKTSIVSTDAAAEAAAGSGAQPLAERRSGRMLRLLTEISKTLVTVQPLPQVLARVVDLVFDVVPAERAFLLLRESFDTPLTAQVMRNRDGSVPANVSLSRTVVNTVMRDRTAILASDARYDPRLDMSNSIFGMNLRSFMCGPLWNRNEVIGVLYCDNPRSRQFSAEDLEVFTALCNYAAVAIEQARLAQQLLEESKRRERLQRYHSPNVIKRILSGDDDHGFRTQERDVSVMFCDLVGFTTICEQMSPADVASLLNDFFARMADGIFEHEGTLDKFIGDAILAVFGAPFDQPDHAQRAVAAAIDMRRELKKLNAERGGPALRMRIAINSGMALTGDIGSPKRREFTVLGDVVNTASRLESEVAQPDQIVISQATRERLGGDVQVRPLGPVTPRGREAAVEVFEVL